MQLGGSLPRFSNYQIAAGAALLERGCDSTEVRKTDIGKTRMVNAIYGIASMGSRGAFILALIDAFTSLMSKEPISFIRYAMYRRDYVKSGSYYTHSELFLKGQKGWLENLTIFRIFFKGYKVIK